MSTIKSSAENLTLNADGANNDIKFQSNGSEVASIDQAGLFIANKLKVGTGDNGTITSTHALALDAPSGEPLLFRNNGNDIARFRPGGGLCFGTDTAANNALDDYEEGTWVPTLVCSSSGSYTLDTGSNLAAYTKIGRVVHIQGSIGIASESSPNGNLRMSLPFTSFTGTKDTDNSMGNATLEAHGGTVVNGINIFVFGAAYAQFPFIADNGTFDYLDHSHVDTAFSIKFSFSYIAV